MINEKARILLVDDDDIDREAIERYLFKEKFLCTIEHAESKAIALDLLQKNAYDIVLLDYNLGDGTGLEILPKIHDIPVIFVTGSGSEDVAVKAMSQGAYDYLIKDLPRNYIKVLPSTLQNVLNRKRAEEESKAAQEELDSILRTVPDIIYRLNNESLITFISDSVRKYGYQPEDLIGKSVFDIVHPEDKEKAEYRINERRRGDRSTKSFELKLLTKNQVSIPFEIFSISADGLYSSKKIDADNYIGTQGTARDITERKQTEKTLQENEKKYRTLFNSSADAISIINLDTGKFVDCNKAAVELHDTGNRENYIGLTSDQLSPKFQPNGELSSKLSAEYIQTAFKEGVKTFEWTHCKSDGTPFPVIVTLSAMVLGEKRFVLAFGKDITDRKQAEEGREKLIKALQEALENVKTLRGLLPICAKCKKIRDDKGYWNSLEGYIEEHSSASFSHGICSECSDELYGDEKWYIEMKKNNEKK